MDELLRIDPEFESKIPPLTEEEYQLLEENILQDGVVLNPLIVWNFVLFKHIRKSNTQSLKRSFLTAMPPLLGFAVTSLVVEI